MVEVFRGLQGFLELEKEWRELTAHDSRYWIQFPFYRELVVHTLYDQNDLVFFRIKNSAGGIAAIFPARKTEMRIRGLKFGGLELFGSSENDMTWEMSSTDFPLAAGESPREVLRILVSQIPHVLKEPSLLYIGRITEQSHAFIAFNELAKHAIPDSSDGGHKWLDVNRSYADFQESLVGKFRISLRSCKRNLSDLGPVSFTHTRASDPSFFERYSEFLEVESSGWKGDDGTQSSLMAHPVQNMRRFFESLIELPQGELSRATAEIFTLRVGDKPIAAQYCWLSGNTRVAFRIGYVQAYARYQPGMLLINHIVRLSCEDSQVTTVDFVSDAAWLDKWQISRSQYHGYYLPIRPLHGLLARVMLTMPTKQSVIEQCQAIGKRVSQKMSKIEAQPNPVS